MAQNPCDGVSPGDPCDDSDPNTINDAIDENCNCTGISGWANCELTPTIKYVVFEPYTPDISAVNDGLALFQDPSMSDHINISIADYIEPDYLLTRDEYDPAGNGWNENDINGIGTYFEFFWYEAMKNVGEIPPATYVFIHGSLPTTGYRVGGSGGYSWIATSINALAHEIGHDLGALHSECDNNVMCSGTVGTTWSSTSVSQIANAQACTFCEEGDLDCLPLAVEQLTLRATKTNMDILLNWTMLNETNNKGFWVEWKWENEPFQKIGWVAGKNNASNDYSFILEKPKSGMHYFRLQQVDFNGQIEVSAIVDIEMDEWEDFNAYPNPVTDILNIQAHFLSPQMSSLSMYNSIGQLFFEKEYHGMEVEDFFSVDSYLPGIYYLTLQTRKGQYTEKVIIY